jgi:hypothetical protein
MYVKVFNTTQFYQQMKVSNSLFGLFPNISNASSYDLSTVDELGKYKSIYVPGPHTEEIIFLIVVSPSKDMSSTSTAKYNLVATTYQSAVLLQAGVPQSHFVAMGTMEYFKFYLNELETIHIMVTARSGDPDLLVSMDDQKPLCVRNTYGPADCANYTWASLSYSTDQIVISRDLPCTAMSIRTRVSPSCNPESSYHVGFVYIGVFGFTESKFTIMIAPQSQNLILIPGQSLYIYLYTYHHY